MDLARCWRHLVESPRSLRRRFPDAALERVERAVHEAESGHGAEIRIAIEAGLDLLDVAKDLQPRERALQVFSQLGVWDTERNNGVLIYVLLADRDVEIVADRGFNGRVQPSQWEAVCVAMEKEFSLARWEQGLMAGLEAVRRLAVQHFPAAASDRNEQPDRPDLL